MARKFYRDVNGSYPEVHFENTAPSDTTLIIDRDENIQLMKQKYEERQKDGENLFNEKRAEVYFDFTQGAYGDVSDENSQDYADALQAVLSLESHLKPISDQLIRGDWLTAFKTCENLPESGLFDATFKGLLLQALGQYLTEKY